MGYNPSNSNEEDLFKNLYRLLLALAKMELAQANREVEGTNDWPKGQQWHELGNSSQGTFLRRARDRAGVDHDWYKRTMDIYSDACYQIWEDSMSSPYQLAARLPVGTVIEATFLNAKRDRSDVAELVRVNEGDNDFRTTDDNSELSFSWDMEYFKVVKKP